MIVPVVCLVARLLRRAIQLSAEALESPKTHAREMKTLGWHIVVAITASGLATSGCGLTSRAPSDTSSEDAAAYLFVWATDADSVNLNFLAVLDVQEGSVSYGQVLATLAVPTAGRTRGHHTEHVMPESGYLFTNDFGTGKTYVLDLRNPLVPTVADSFVAAGDFTSPHSFERLPNGNVLATFQNRGPGNEEAGGIAELDERGAYVRGSGAATGNLYIRPYSLAIVPALDRVVTGSADMRGAGNSRVLQIWRLSDLSLLHTLPVPEEWGAAAEPRVLSDGRTVLVTTFGCSLVRVVDLAGERPQLERVHRFAGSDCALPVVAGRFWIQSVPADNALVTLDVQQPGSPREVHRVSLGSGHWPHWISLEPGGRRIVITGYRNTRYLVILAKLDRSTGAVVVDSQFGEGGVSFNRRSWPHGSSGPADPHGAVFSRKPRER
jgi:hypothetical protein